MGSAETMRARSRSVVSTHGAPYGAVACLAPVFMGFSQAAVQSGLPFPSPTGREASNWHIALFFIRPYFLREVTKLHSKIDGKVPEISQVNIPHQSRTFVLNR